jgi:hypothetical protein
MPISFQEILIAFEFAGHVEAAAGGGSIKLRCFAAHPVQLGRCRPRDSHPKNARRARQAGTHRGRAGRKD